MPAKDINVAFLISLGDSETWKNYSNANLHRMVTMRTVDLIAEVSLIDNSPHMIVSSSTPHLLEHMLKLWPHLCHTNLGPNVVAFVAAWDLRFDHIHLLAVSKYRRLFQGVKHEGVVLVWGQTRVLLSWIYGAGPSRQGRKASASTALAGLGSVPRTMLRVLWRSNVDFVVVHQSWQ